MSNALKIGRGKREMLILAMQIKGPSGSGKTVGGLILAYGMMKAKYPDMSDYDLWGKIGVIDTEHRRSLIYVGMKKGDITIGEFIHGDLQAPYTVERYQNMALMMKKEGVEVVVVDSLSHAWAGEGGVLDYNENANGNNKFKNWNTTNKEAYNPLVSFAVGETTGVHTITTVRTKQSYESTLDELGKLKIEKVGLKPIQRDEFEYEFQIVLDVDMEHKITPQKDNSDIFEGYNGSIVSKQGAELYKWLETGVDVFAEREAEAKREAEERRLQAIKEEENRQALAKTVRQLEKDYDLGVYVKSMEEHPAISNPVENMPLTTLRQLYAAMEQKIQALEENKAKTKTKAEKGAN